MRPQSQNWLDTARNDYKIAGYLLDKKEYLYCLFFCQQAVEKTLKALYSEKYGKTSPRKHDLTELAEAANIFSELDDKRIDLFITLSEYYIESRYAEDRKELAKSCTKAIAKKIMDETGVVLKWLEGKLN